jgi:hypothetical protein
MTITQRWRNPTGLFPYDPRLDPRDRALAALYARSMRSTPPISMPIPTNPADLRDARVEPGLGAPDAVDFVIIEGSTEVRLTMPRDSLGDLGGAVGFLPAMKEILGDPPGRVVGFGLAVQAQASIAASLDTPGTDTPEERKASALRLLDILSPAMALLSAPLPSPPRELRVDPASAILCVGCETYFTPDVTLSFTGPDTVRFDGMALCPCCSGPREPTIVRGREDEAPESGVYLIVEDE